MAEGILPQRSSYSPTNDSIDAALVLISIEREKLVALSILLTNHMEALEREREDSTALIVMGMLQEQIASTKTIKIVTTMLTGGQHD